MQNTHKKHTISDILGPPISEDEALALIKTNAEVYNTFLKFNYQYQKQVLEFICGSRGLPILYDAFFKSILNPVNTPERLENFLSCLLGQKVTIIDILPLEGSQMTAESSFVIMDVRLQLEDGSFVTVEMQKHE